jgi:hypothetical protein
METTGGLLPIYDTEDKDQECLANQQHWVLNVQFKKDDSPVRKDHLLENMALIRRVNLNAYSLPTIQSMDSSYINLSAEALYQGRKEKV